MVKNFIQIIKIIKVKEMNKIKFLLQDHKVFNKFYNNFQDQFNK